MMERGVLFWLKSEQYSMEMRRRKGIPGPADTCFGVSKNSASVVFLSQNFTVFVLFFSGAKKKKTS